MAWLKSNINRVIDRVLVASLLLAIIGVPSARADEPFGLKARVPWTASRLAGSPEPPLPFTVEKVFTKLESKNPIYIADEPGTDSLWVIQSVDDKIMRIVRVKDDFGADRAETLLDLAEQQVYSACFHPDYATNGFVYIFSNGPKPLPDRMNRITRYTVDRQAPRGINPDSAEVIIEWKSGGHDGGDMAFGTDRMLYITSGDGTSDSDLWDSGQTLNDLLGGVLRIDVEHREGGRPYAVPRDNPFVDTPGARPEIWAYGLRNPWRMSADLKSGQIWVGNNGQDLWEQAYLIRRGENYGWSVYEGGHPFYLERRRGPTPHVPPTIEHPHALFRSLTGGVVYRGDKHPDLDGVYIYGDYSSGRIWGMKHDGQKPLWHRELADTSLQIAAFRVDHHGELLVADYGSGIYRIVPLPPRKEAPPFPTLLSETGLFRSAADQQPDAGVIPYSVIAPGWTDGARADHFMAVPGSEKVGFEAGSTWRFPDGTALVQTLTLGDKAGQEPSGRRIETRVLLRQQGEWAGYSYRWNAEQTDATLVAIDGEDLALPPGPGGVDRKWRIPSRSECMACHSRAANFVLGVSGLQLNRDHDYGGTADNQLRTLDHIGFFESALSKPPQDLERLADPADGSADLERRARTYLYVNCSSCHVEAGGGNAKMELNFGTPREKTNLIGARPQHDTFGIANAMLVAPGEPDRSVLVHRLSTRGRGQMPPLVSNRVDEKAVGMIREWIAGLKPERPFVRAWKVEDLAASIDTLPSGRSIESGRKTFREVGCLQCHRAEGEGGSVGPDLAGVAGRLGRLELLESVLLPSKVIADEYANHLIETEDGTVVSGKIEREDDKVVVLRPPSSGDPVAVEKAKILERRRSDLSNMPLGMVDVLEKEQLLDLLAYLLNATQPAKPEAK
ncbi:PQQ-dependent sugar dehydrogenase [Tundrisphaera lichenicola]|uniref:PQQ-dependent sugar dehydrogenase n=1 Tax=Tundrisphaera lichenicola TaxID=2029860 RepID=UPI003EBE8D71